MNKQEAIENINDLWSFVLEDGPFEVDLVNKNQVSDIISQIDEPQKVVVPKFVADWVDDSREYRFDFYEWFDWNKQPKIVQLWLNSENKRRAELNALALVTLIVNGANAVEIEQEKLYTVEIPNPNNKHYMNVLNRMAGKIIVITLTKPCTTYFKNKEYQLTESEIKEDFEWAWDAGFAKEVE